jgi:mono/diheme cytochrome c family protein
MKALILSVVFALAGSVTAGTSETEKIMAIVYGDYPHRDTPEAAIYRGGIVFHHYCSLCHGIKADGKGRTAGMYDPKPANLVTSDKNDDYKELIIRRGGGAIGRSQYMPPWEDELTEEQISDVVAYLRSIGRNSKQ